jgi:hypothetical protein
MTHLFDRIVRGPCKYCGRIDDLLDGYCSPKCDSQSQIYGSKSEKQKSVLQRNCEQCGKPFLYIRNDKRFCSNICRMKHNNHIRKCTRPECTICHPEP